MTNWVVVNGVLRTGGTLLFPDGISTLPAMSFVTEPTLGFWRSSAGNVTLQGALNTTGNIVGSADLWAGAANAFVFASRGQIRASANGNFSLANSAATIGSQIKVDALPTIASGFGTSPAITAGSTPLAGSINVGTGGTATTGVINFNGTAFPSAPFVIVTTTLTNAVTRVTAISTTQLTLTSTTAWTASDIISWHCISPK